LQLISGRTHQCRGQLHRSGERLTPTAVEDTETTAGTEDDTATGPDTDTAAAPGTYAGSSGSSAGGGFLSTMHIAGDNLYPGATSSASTDRYCSSPFLALQVHTATATNSNS
jgi:hypothetical protein